MLPFAEMKDAKERIARATRPYLFRNGTILTDLPEEDLKLIKSSAKSDTLKRGEILFKQGAYPKGVYWLISGKVKIYQETSEGNRQTLYIYSDGDLMGHRQFLAEESHPVSASLLEDASVLLISGDTFRGLLNSSPFFARNVLVALAREFSVWMNRTTVFTKYPVRYRLILALLILHEQYRTSGSKPGFITMTRTELAEYVGASLATVVRALNKLKSANLVQVQGRRIELPDVSGLLDEM
ncbi:MAG TPA: Crp/Fnr family transcriptional regulator [Saprospiraceae bacterium]|nr:Crp/Fnr family transcriptional regulator [Saprospiraceae bacterium]